MQHTNAPTHLDELRLAALDVDPPSPDELAHLAVCAQCRAERDAYAALATQAGVLGASASADAPRLVPWDRLSSALRAEGLLTTTAEITPLRTAAVSPLIVRTLDGAGVHVPETPAANVAVGGEAASARTAEQVTPLRPARTPFGARALRYAAALLAIVGSAAVGRATANGVPLASSSAPAPALLASNEGASEFGSVEEATETLARAQQQYERAALWLAGNDTTTRSSEVYRARLAALDQMMAASRAALREAPQDPVLNHYFLAASTAREATLQQLGSALPVDKTIESY